MSFRGSTAGEITGAMSARSAGELLALPVTHNEIALGHAVDILLDLPAGRALGLQVRCGDETSRFLPLGAARFGVDATDVGSPLALIDDLAFYRARGTGLRELRGTEVSTGARAAGALADVLVDDRGAIEAVIVQTPSGRARLAFGPQLRFSHRRRVTAA